MGKSKAQGTAWETAIVTHFKDEGFDMVGRIPEGGANDLGDILLHDHTGTPWILEAKATERLNVTRVLAKARVKAGGTRTALVWRRLVKTGKQKRQPDGEKVVVVITLDQFTELLNERNDRG